MAYFMARNVRQAIGEHADACSNRSLFTDKYPDLPRDSGDTGAKSTTLDRIVRIRPDHRILESRLRFLNAVRGAGRPATSFVARLCGRLIIDQAGGVLENAGLKFDRHAGCPCIPGSALKGIASNAALQSGAQRGAMLAVFGWSSGDKDLPESIRNTNYAGSVSFLASFPLQEAPLGIDILTCHHPKYYGGIQTDPTDTESPIPNSFPVVEAGPEFVFVVVNVQTPTRSASLRELLSLPADFDPLALARAWLIDGLTDRGAGAKTAVGYGWFSYDPDAEIRREREEQELRVKVEAELRRQAEEQARLAAMDPVDRAALELGRLNEEEFSHFARSLADKPRDEQLGFLRLLGSKAKKDRWKAWKKNKKDLADSIRKVASELGEALP